MKKMNVDIVCCRSRGNGGDGSGRESGDIYISYRVLAWPRQYYSNLLSLNSRLVSKNPFQQNEFEFGLLKALVYHQ